MKRRRRNRESTAYHEAGHAVAAFVLGLKIGKRGVSIVPNREKDLVGLAHVPVQVRERPDRAVSGRTRLHLEQQAIMCFAGDAAERKFDGRRRFGGRRDYQHAAKLLAPLATSWEQHDARIEVARLGARDIVDATWSSIQAVAEELLRNKDIERSRCEEDCPALREGAGFELTYERRAERVA